MCTCQPIGSVSWPHGLLVIEMTSERMCITSWQKEPSSPLIPYRATVLMEAQDGISITLARLVFTEPSHFGQS